MNERGKVLKSRIRQWELKAREVSKHCRFSTDTIRMLGRQPFAEDSLNEIEEAIEKARQHKMKVLQTAG